MMTSAIVQLGKDYPDLLPALGPVQLAFEKLVTAFKNGGKLMVCGNGGSAADADHIVGELVKGFLLKRRIPLAHREKFIADHGADGEKLAEYLQEGLPVISLTGHPALTSAFGNDVAPELVFAQQTYVYGKAGDVLLAISTSGNSSNVLNALRVARSRGVLTLGLSGESGGLMLPLCDVIIRVPHGDTPRIQERHLPIYHALCVSLESHFFK